MTIIRFVPLMAGIMLAGQAFAAPTQGAPPQAHQDHASTSGSTSAAPQSPGRAVRLSAADLDRVTAGLGRDNVATQPWPALLDAGFSLHHNINSDNGVIDHAGHLGVAVPSTVPNSFCVAFC